LEGGEEIVGTASQYVINENAKFWHRAARISGRNPAQQNNPAQQKEEQTMNLTERKSPHVQR
jgi:hypothetical protein